MNIELFDQITYKGWKANRKMDEIREACEARGEDYTKNSEWLQAQQEMLNAFNEQVSMLDMKFGENGEISDPRPFMLISESIVRVRMYEEEGIGMPFHKSDKNTDE